MIGKMLTHYEITSQIGKGGMGEVYRAKDQKLGRDVAIKVLPEEFAKDADRIARFQREAKLLASLNHPNIAAIYGLEESGGTNFLVLELVEGETLSDRIKAGPVPVEESLKLALQITEALEAAHEKGVIHRDLKPANIKVTPDGKVKVLDFGLAKAFAGEKAEVNLSHSPTLSDAATKQGVILGTAAYMSPEQARGKPVDKRTDIWAFGCVLYEMLTGQAAFQGEDLTEILASVVKGGANLQRLPADLHPRAREAISRCLQKDLRKRFQDIGDIRCDFDQILSDPGSLLLPGVAPAETGKSFRRMLPWLAATLVFVMFAGVAFWILKRTPSSEPRKVIRFTYELPKGQQFSTASRGNSIPLAISPDGDRFVYGTTDGLYLREMDQLDARHISGTDKDSLQPFFSPDGKWIGYFSSSDRKLKKVAVNGSAPIVLCDIGTVSGGASWESDDTIVYADMLSGSVMRVSADGGIPKFLIKNDPAKARGSGFPVQPSMLPDGKNLLFSNISPNGSQLVVQSLKSGQRKVLVDNAGGFAIYLPTGHLVYSTRGGF